MTDTALAKSRKRSILIPLLLLITLAACAGAGYAWWKMHKSAAPQAKAEEHIPVAPVFLAMDTFTVNLGDADRVLYVGITLRLKDEATRQRISDFLPEVRSRLILLFSRQNAQELATDNGKQKLIDAIKTTLAAPLIQGQPGQVVSDVLYTAFILR